MGGGQYTSMPPEMVVRKEKIDFTGRHSASPYHSVPGRSIDQGPADVPQDLSKGLHTYRGNPRDFGVDPRTQSPYDYRREEPVPRNTGPPPAHSQRPYSHTDAQGHTSRPPSVEHKSPSPYPPQHERQNLSPAISRHVPQSSSPYQGIPTLLSHSSGVGGGGIVLKYLEEKSETCTEFLTS